VRAVVVAVVLAVEVVADADAVDATQSGGDSGQSQINPRPRPSLKALNQHPLGTGDESDKVNRSDTGMGKWGDVQVWAHGVEVEVDVESG
jgi:hypothetical protein